MSNRGWIVEHVGSSAFDTLALIALRFRAQGDG